jgi:hypothetical protein
MEIKFSMLNKYLQLKNGMSVQFLRLKDVVSVIRSPALHPPRQSITSIDPDDVSKYHCCACCR